jgi:hypothetical protein
MAALMNMDSSEASFRFLWKLLHSVLVGQCHIVIENEREFVVSNRFH